jgi:Alpha-kinase family
VAKRYKTPECADDESLYRRDCVMQMRAKQCAQAYNVLPAAVRKVDFLAAFLLQLVDRPGAPFYACERMVHRGAPESHAAGVLALQFSAVRGGADCGGHPGRE